MNKHIKSLFVALMAAAAPTLALTSCSEKDYYDVDINGVPEVANYADAFKVTVDQETNVATFEFTGKGVYPVWIVDGKSYSSAHKFTKYYRKAGDYSIEYKVGNGNGVSKDAGTLTFSMEKTKMQGFAGIPYDNPANLWPKAEIGDATFFIAPGWNAITTYSYKFTGDGYTLMIPEELTERWQGQVTLPTNINLTAEEKYDVSLIVTTSLPVENGLLKIHPKGDDDNEHSFIIEPIKTAAGDPKCFYLHDVPAVIDMENLDFTFDWGPCPAGVEIIIENIVIAKSSEVTGVEWPEAPVTPDVPEPAWVAWDSADNLFFGATVDLSSYYANPDWSGRDGLVWEQTAPDTFFAGIPLAVAERWQCQCAINTNIAIDDPEQLWDFYCELESNIDIPKVMFKVVETDEDGVKHDNNFLFADEQPVGAGSSTFWRAGVKPAVGAIHALTFMFDFGTAPDETEVTIKKIILQKHHD